MNPARSCGEGGQGVHQISDIVQGATIDQMYNYESQVLLYFIFNFLSTI